ncbi:MAG: tetratricopeptide repeat protein [Bdellovibrionales bacterium]|jgi:TolA-binding protein|nr:tetratricopeptide repeat protein [Bdellovibrionales bacterium]MBT3525851.1 tetratricopeptide repeat protein [Bdellovibrionales bacterium]MBT7669184.1 tetratricopeptide repeat protein [Bdellovibrionales bacterium]MBT7766587.1 tetratricopeptide repeat protein [Bdellovibrionales bacterium]
MIYKILITLTALLVLISCKTTEEIEREQMVQNLAGQMVQAQKVSAESTVQVQNLEHRINKVIGSMEEANHHRDQQIKNFIQQSQKNLDHSALTQQELQQQADGQKKQIQALQSALQEQRKYLDRLLKSIEKISKRKGSSSKRRGVKLSSYDHTMSLYRKARYPAAKVGLLKLLDNNKIKGNRRARVLHNLGMIAFMDKEYKKASVYFSRLFTNFPKAPYNPNGLLYLGKSFYKNGDATGALETFKEMVKRYPKAKQVKDAQKIMNKIQAKQNAT